MVLVNKPVLSNPFHRTASCLVYIIVGYTYALHFRWGENVQHFKILRDGGGRYFLWIVKFKSINELLEYHRQSSVSRSQTIYLKDMVEEDKLVSTSKVTYDIACWFISSYLYNLLGCNCKIMVIKSMPPIYTPIELWWFWSVCRPKRFMRYITSTRRRRESWALQKEQY